MEKLVYIPKVGTKTLVIEYREPYQDQIQQHPGITQLRLSIDFCLELIEGKLSHDWIIFTALISTTKFNQVDYILHKSRHTNDFLQNALDYHVNDPSHDGFDKDELLSPYTYADLVSKIQRNVGEGLKEDLDWIDEPIASYLSTYLTWENFNANEID